MDNIYLWIGIWATVLIFTIFLEALTVDLVSIWFSAGSFVALILAAFSVLWYIQVAVFLILSVILLFGTRPLLSKYYKRNETKMNIESIIGQVGTVIKDIPIDDLGEIKLNGTIWTAISNEELKQGEKAEIIAIQGNKMCVKKHII